jgi:hypothetical protein
MHRIPRPQDELLAIARHEDAIRNVRSGRRRLNRFGPIDIIITGFVIAMLAGFGLVLLLIVT